MLSIVNNNNKKKQADVRENYKRMTLSLGRKQRQRSEEGLEPASADGAAHSMPGCSLDWLAFKVPWGECLWVLDF